MFFGIRLKCYAVFENRDLAVAQLLAFGELAACDLKHQIKQALGRVADRLAIRDRTGIKVDPAGFLRGKLAVAGDLDGRRRRAERRAAAGGEQDNVRARRRHGGG